MLKGTFQEIFLKIRYVGIKVPFKPAGNKPDLRNINNYDTMQKIVIS